MLELKSVFKAGSLNEALTLLNEYGDKSKIIAGGTDLIIALREGKLNSNVLVDVSSLEEIKFIEDKGDYIEIGAGTTFTEVWNNEILKKEFNALCKAARMVGSPQIRNRGTVGGNIANGSPAADTAPVFVALDGVCTIKSLNSEREVNVKDIYLGKGKVDIKSNEIMYSIKIKKLAANQKLGFAKLGLRNSLAISRLSMAVNIKIENNLCTECKIGSGSLSVNTERESKMESFLIGKNMDSANVNKVSEDIGSYIKERLNGRSTMAFKSEAVKGIFKEATLEALKQLV